MSTTAGPNGSVELRVEHNVAELRATDPDRRNCISFEFAEDLYHHTRELEEQKDEIYAIVLTHEGAVYCAGYDLDVIAGGDHEGTGKELRERYHAPNQWLTNVDIPVVVGATGPAVAGGAGHLLVGDIVVVGPVFRMWWSEINVGLFPHTMGASFIETYGIRRAAELTFLGREAKLTPAECREMGIANRIVETEEVDRTVREMGETLAEYEREYGYLLDAYEVFNLAKREHNAPSNAGTHLGRWLGTYDQWYGEGDPRTGGKDDPRQT